MKHVVISIIILVLALLLAFWLSVHKSDVLQQSLKQSEDSIALFKHHQVALLHEIEKSEVREQRWKDSVQVLLDSVKVLNKKDSVLHHRLASVKPKVYSGNELTQIWDKRYAGQISPIVSARDIEFPIRLSTGSFIQADLQRLDISNEIIKNDSSRIEYLQDVVNEQDSVASEKDRQIKDYKDFVKVADKTDSTRVDELKSMTKEIRRQKRQKVIFIVVSGVVIVLALL